MMAYGLTRHLVILGIKKSLYSRNWCNIVEGSFLGTCVLLRENWKVKELFSLQVVHFMCWGLSSQERCAVIRAWA